MNKLLSKLKLLDPYAARKTVTFGDSSVISGKGGRGWTVFSVGLLLIIWFFAGVFDWIDPLFWPSMQSVWQQFILISTEGYRNFTLWEHIGISLFRVIMGFLIGCVIGIPLGFALALSKTMNRLFDPIVEFFRPMPPLALIPLVILWLGIGEGAKVFLLFLAAIWIMAISTRSGALATRLSKVHAAYTLNANKKQILRYVILPNTLPEIFIGMRVCMGVCWGTVVAAELVAAEKGIGMMIMVASKFLSTDIVVLGIIIIGIIAYLIDLLMRFMESKMIPWRGKV